MNTSARFAKWVFLIAGVYGLIVSVPLLFLEEKMGIDYPPPTNHPEQYYGFTLVVIAWAVLFICISRDPLKYRLMMIPAILEKIPYAVTVFILSSQGRIAEMNVTFGIIDLVWGILFTIAYFKTKESTMTA
ncbi:MAG: hypothetical protein L0287_31290 [Anaerolineae bacterium]|nr:hypothetical protein [Anaerolineae bacterium]MCI0707871.1 hypothetical protein [Ignavibacteriota bacterium]MCI0707930.1 hypothetical protein [Ignavibacteriota bacterium]